MDRQELGEAIIAHTQLLYRVSCGLLRCEADREDAVQSAIEKAWRQADRLRDAKKLRSWLIRILVNECRSLLRKKQRETPFDTLPDLPGPDDARALREALASLPDELRLPLMLHYIEGLSVQEIASALGRPKGTILSRMHRGRGLLRDILGSEGF